MSRPCCIRKIGGLPAIVLFKPAGVPARLLEHVILELDEVEALRLADGMGLYQEEAAERMNISRPTFSRIIERARKKVADALLHGKALRIEGGAVEIAHGDNTMNEHARQRRGRDAGPCGTGTQQVNTPAHTTGEMSGRRGNRQNQPGTGPQHRHGRRKNGGRGNAGHGGVS